MTTSSGFKFYNAKHYSYYLYVMYVIIHINVPKKYQVLIKIKQYKEEPFIMQYIIKKAGYIINSLNSMLGNNKSFAFKL